MLVSVVDPHPFNRPYRVALGLLGKGRTDHYLDHPGNRIHTTSPAGYAGRRSTALTLTAS